MQATKRAKDKAILEFQKEERDRMTVYISKSLAKKFKIFAIEEEKDFSQLAEIAFTQYLEKHRKLKS